MQNFIGKDGYNWFVGVVENRIDPLNLGRCQVRIFGWHTENKQELPTSDLPWCLPSQSPNTTQSFSTPKEGSYVTGFFSDGMSGQAPILTGVLPGLYQSSGGDKGFQDPRTPEQIAAAPKPPEGQQQEYVGEPTTAPIARGVFKNTALAKAYESREHNCDICAGVNKDLASAKAEIMKFVGEVRKSIEAFFDEIKSSPAAEDIKQEVAALKSKIKSLQKEIQPVLDEVKALQEYIQKMQALIAEIQALPADLQKLLASCLSEATSALSGAQNQLLSISTADLAAKQTLINNATKTINSANTG